MNPRVLELLKNPKNIQSEDLGLLKEEIHAFPYVQNIRALHLFGVHLYDKENYQKELSTTAAYTTDKKLLYQLINGKIVREPKTEKAEDRPASKTPEKQVKYSYKEKTFPIKREKPAETKKDKYEEAANMIQPPKEIRHIHVNGERNRILFEGEEDFLDKTDSEVIDLESTLESGVIVTHKTEPVTENLTVENVEKPVTDNNERVEDSEAGVEFTPELIVEEDKMDSPAEELEINKESEVSFHEVETLAPETEAVQEPEENEAVETESVDESVNEEEIPEPDDEISFHGMDEFLPDVKIQGNSDDTAVAAEISKPNVNKHEEEMRRLIEEVEKKMKEAQPAPKVENEEPETADDEISFAETQSFHFWSNEKEDPTAEEAAETVESVKEQPIQHEEPVEIEEKAKEQETAVQEASGWKPMSLDSNLPDSMISKENPAPSKPETPKEDEIPAIQEKQHETVPQIADEPQKAHETALEDKLQVAEEKIPETEEEKHEEIENSEPPAETKTPKEEAPVMNVSFFGTDISSLAAKKETAQEIKTENTEQTPADSNVSGFINTWQSWLKIDRAAEEAVEQEKTPVQEKVIEAFIENNPRISQLRDESTYVVKEKNDDISHLMTETLANLYFEQKLYTKAIKAFEILINKTPEKKKYFQSKIQEIKDFRSKS
ncbi:midas domain-containing protein [Chryseobacterium luteum]|uniref:Tetratricopeptide repeat protein n=1 Tax=Chryseobacterium luteum TaxID=421531 RepID=A0A085ZYA2_9FLAO|nr:hypothetical protein [Chryseobacterium luteum]KFF09416.1 hypothetical protein IX38_02690 [Chryseobacterium luteum]